MKRLIILTSSYTTNIHTNILTVSIKKMEIDKIEIIHLLNNNDAFIASNGRLLTKELIEQFKNLITGNYIIYDNSSGEIAKKEPLDIRNSDEVIDYKNALDILSKNVSEETLSFNQFSERIGVEYNYKDFFDITVVSRIMRKMVCRLQQYEFNNQQRRPRGLPLNDSCLSIFYCPIEYPQHGADGRKLT